MKKREKYKVICTDCGNEAEVPFKPDENRPVYCKECFQKHRTSPQKTKMRAAERSGPAATKNKNGFRLRG